MDREPTPEVASEFPDEAGARTRVLRGIRHVAFKATSDAVRIEPPFRSPDQAACRGDENPACWEVRTLDRAKEVKWTLTPPRLTQLGPLADPITVDINWTVYDTETKKRLRAGTSGLTVRGDASP